MPLPALPNMAVQDCKPPMISCEFDRCIVGQLVQLIGTLCKLAELIFPIRAVSK